MTHMVDAHVGKKIRQQRWLLGISQQQLASRVGIKFQQVQKYETGANRVSASRLWDIAAVLEVPISYFFEGLEGRPVGARDTRGDVLTDKEALDLVRAYHVLPDAQRRHLFDLARAIGRAA